jgi:aminoglycoside phosphotransferase (APT) family kinase protein
MPELSREKVEKYLGALFGEPVNVHALIPLGREASSIKAYGYGTPVRVDYESQEGRRSAVLHTIGKGGFGHERMSDRARELLWERCAFNLLPNHIRALDVGGFASNHGLVSLSNVEEFFLLTEYAQGQEYAADLQRILATGEVHPEDVSRADALCDYLAQIHKVRRADPQLYLRRARELVGANDCIMGLADSYPPDCGIGAGILEEIEHLCVGWRWRLKRYSHRLRQIHGDFHPWNILFDAGSKITLLDRSRGEFGDPADDLTCLTLNYIFFSLQRSGRLEGGFEKLFLRFWERYLDRTGDREILEVAAPYCAFRGLVMASPVWYPRLAGAVRTALVRFMLAVLSADRFDPALVNQYCGL